MKCPLTRFFCDDQTRQKMLINWKLCKEAVVAHFKTPALYRYLPSGTEENHEHFQSERPVFGGEIWAGVPSAWQRRSMSVDEKLPAAQHVCLLCRNKAVSALLHNSWILICSKTDNVLDLFNGVRWYLGQVWRRSVKDTWTWCPPDVKTSHGASGMSPLTLIRLQDSSPDWFSHRLYGPPLCL